MGNEPMNTPEDRGILDFTFMHRLAVQNPWEGENRRGLSNCINKIAEGVIDLIDSNSTAEEKEIAAAVNIILDKLDELVVLGFDTSPAVAGLTGIKPFDKTKD